ncbi:myosin-2-like [Iris pallida]|uniref:Myosin-2-like n=1 Tax=Iris pallida TaxID=29817 RepID=A0AAX6HMY3_IRIPA|nr:myosin-2-like [Iris pallida]
MATTIVRATPFLGLTRASTAAPNPLRDAVSMGNRKFTMVLMMRSWPIAWRCNTRIGIKSFNFLPKLALSLLSIRKDSSGSAFLSKQVQAQL